MSCEYCDHKGYIMDNRSSDNGYKRVMVPCPRCDDKAAYNKKVKELYAPTKKRCKVLPFRRP